MKSLHIIGMGIVLVLCVVINNYWDNEYRRPIIGDAKGYYAYLPATFIYQDLSFSFTEAMEAKYYLDDGSLSKDFLVEQPNGTSVNKCFPGTAIFYLPFFLLAYFFSFLIGLPLDGYAPLFQFSIVAAHLFFYMLALIFLERSMRKLNFNFFSRIAAPIAITFGSNAFYYLVYDFSVAHIFGFFGASWMLYLFVSFQANAKNTNKKSWHYLGLFLVTMALLVITRPTNALVILAAPLFIKWSTLKNFAQTFSWKNMPWLAILISTAIACIPPILWKIQTGTWLVYSYGDEKLNLLQPHLGQFLFSVQKGWWFWSPMMLIVFLGGTWFFFKNSKFKGIYFFGSILFIAYIFSCWWMWTFGMGLGQRPMIDFYPIFVIGFAGFLHVFPRNKLILFVSLPLISINLVHAHQINKFILVGGSTTWSEYQQNILRLKRQAPMVDIQDTYILHSSKGYLKKIFVLNSENHFSPALEFDDIPAHSMLVVNTTIGGKHEDRDLCLVIASSDGSYYKAAYFGTYLYKKPRTMSFAFEIGKNGIADVKIYFWNNGSKSTTKVTSFEVLVYLPDLKTKP